MGELVKGKIALVTGGTAGIGKAVARRLLCEGADRVILFGRNRERGLAAVEELTALGQGHCEFFSVDVADYRAVKEAIDLVLEKYGRIDTLINNAGITKDQLLMKVKEEDWDTVVDINLKSVYNLCHHLVRSMMKAKSGSIINISSVIGLIGNPGQVAYSAAKAGIVGITKALAKELATRNIRVNCIAPGFIDTEMTQVLNEAQQESIKNKIPMGRIGSADEIASAVVFLASELSSYITGQVVVVDGGMVM